MRRFKNILFLLVAMVWLPMSAHCQLEFIPGFEQLRCAEKAPQPAGKDCGECCAVEKPQYRSEQGPLVLPAPVMLPVFLACVLSIDTEQSPYVERNALVAPLPELLSSWRFISRTALPPRAPSFVS